MRNGEVIANGEDENEEREEEAKPIKEEDGDGVEDGEGQGLAPVCIPCGIKPSVKEVDEHVKTHLPFRNWCKHCVFGKAKNNPHRMMDKEEIHEAVFYASYKETKEEMKRYDKLKEIKDEDFRKEQDYMEERAMDTARMAFRIRTKMVKKVKMNFKNMYKDNLKCEECDMDEDESQEHMLECPGWREERGDLEVTTTKGKVMFFTRVMKKKK